MLTENNKKKEDSIQALSSLEKLNQISYDSIINFMTEYKRKIEGGNPEDLKDLCKTYINKILVYSDRLEIVLNMYPFIGENKEKSPTKCGDTVGHGL